MSEIVVYGVPQSTYVRTVRMALEEKGQPYTLEPRNPRDPAHRAQHPFGKVPAFRHGDVHLYESPAIARYIDEAFDAQPLQPKDIAQRALMTQWISCVEDYVYDAAIRRFLLETLYPSGADGKPDRARLDKALADQRERLAVFESALQGRTVLVGDHVTLADLFLVPIVFYMSHFPESRDVVAALPNITAWLQAMAKRPSFTKTMPPPPPGK